MSEYMNNETSAAEEIEAILPEGWTEDSDFFDTKTWTNGGETPDEEDFFAEDEPAEAAESDKATTESPTTGEEPEKADDAQTPTEEEETAPTTEPETEPVKSKLRFRARIDHEDVDAEIDESDLPTLFQKAAATDRYQKKLAEATPLMERLDAMAKRNGYNSAAEMLDAQDSYDREQAVKKLMDEGAAKTLAEDYVDRQFNNRKAAAATEEKAEPAARDLGAEVRELWTLRPELRGTTLPAEVASAAANGQNLVHAYLNYENKQARTAAENLRKENEVYKQNAASAAKAPVRGVSSGGKTNTEPEDPFLRGFNSAW